jgi:hypothetical protein
MAAREGNHEEPGELSADGLLEAPEGRRAMPLGLSEGGAVCKEEFCASPPVHTRGSVRHTALSIDGPPRPA